MTDYCNHICSCPLTHQRDCSNVLCYDAANATKEKPVTSPNPNSWIQASVETLAETLSSKNSDYAPTGEFSNFEKAEELTGVRVMQIINAQIAIKMTRLQSLWNEHECRSMNEPILDSYLDLAGYAIIAHAYLSANATAPAEGLPDRGDLDQPGVYKRPGW